ncbi:hypothetical protein KR018_005204, partial [Drosophila ironensis]
VVKMIKASCVILIVSLAVLGGAEPLRHRVSARQVQDLPSPAPTGYPEAGITPSVPFDLPTAKPESTYLPPDNTYGPPANTYGPPDNTYGPPEGDYVSEPAEGPEPLPENPVETDDISPAEEEETPEEGSKLLPEEDEPQVEVTEDGSVIVLASSFDNPQSARFFQRFPQGRRRDVPVPQRLTLRHNI